MSNIPTAEALGKDRIAARRFCNGKTAIEVFNHVLVEYDGLHQECEFSPSTSSV